MACSGELWSMDFKLNHVPARSCADNISTGTQQGGPFWPGGGSQAPIAPPPLATGLPGASNSLVDFIMHEYLHKYFENVKKLEIFFIRNMRPLSIRKALPRPGGTGGPSTGSESRGPRPPTGAQGVQNRRQGADNHKQGART